MSVKYVEPKASPLQAKTKMTEKAHREMIARFLETGESNHSGRCTLLGYIVDYCEEHSIPYEIKAVPGVGYSVKKLADNVEELFSKGCEE